jgi:nucleoside-diphosphate-sugar epimerase
MKLETTRLSLGCDEGKRCAETLFFDYFRQHNLKIRVARIFNTYGPRMRSMHAVRSG